jgi:type IV secretory pathway VirB10-like protein
LSEAGGVKIYHLRRPHSKANLRRLFLRFDRRFLGRANQKTLDYTILLRHCRANALKSWGSALGALGIRLMNKTSDIQPTITIRPGKKMGIFVQQDVVFPFSYEI